MIVRVTRRVLIVIVACIAMRPLAAQEQNGRPQTAADSVYARARQLVVSGNGAAGRLLVDSMLAATPPTAPEYADALYWRAALSSNAVSAERDYRRIVVEYPLSPHSGDALWQLASLEVARADRANAATHLQRFLLENPRRPERARAGYLLTRVLLEQGDAVRGCIAYGRARREMPSDSVELANQLEYFGSRCASVDTVGAPVVDSTKVARPKSDSAGNAAAENKPPAPRGPYSLQVGAYSSRADANATAARLKARGYDTRVTGSTRPFRVRIGFYATRADAAAAVKRAAAKGVKAVVVPTSDEK